MTVEVLNANPSPVNPLDAGAEISIDVRTSAGDPFGVLMILVEHAGSSGAFEVAYNKDTGWSPRFDGEVTPVVDGGWIRNTYTFRELPQWSSSFTLRVVAATAAGLTFSGAFLSWTVDSETLVPAVAELPAEVLGGSALQWVPKNRSKESLLDTIKGLFPADYANGLLTGEGAGGELWCGFAQVGARTSLAVDNAERASFISTARGGQKAVGYVSFYRDTAITGVTTRILPGTIVSASRSGRHFVLTSDIVIGAADLGPLLVTAEAIAYGEEYNVLGSYTTAAGEVVPGEIDTIHRMLSDPPVFDPELRVRQDSDFTRGRGASLDGLAYDLGVSEREAGETDAQYRIRIADAKDTVTPGAIERGVNKVLAEFDESACIREVGTPKLPGVFYDAGSSGTVPQAPANNYAYDVDCTVRPEDRFKVLLSIAESHGFFLVGVPRITIPGIGMVYDVDPGAANPWVSAYDVSAGVDFEATPSRFAWGYDSFSRSEQNRTIAASVAAKKAAGVRYDFYEELIGCI